MTKRKTSRKSLTRKKDVLGNRTNPHDCNLLCIGAYNPRVAGGLSYLGTPDDNNPKLHVGDTPVPIYHSSGPISRSAYTNTHDQTKALVSLCLPKRICQSWERVSL
jgi:hypothetical protein